MLSALNRMIIRVSGNGWLFLCATIVMVGSLLALLRIGQAFAAQAAGAQPFDMQMALTSDEAMMQLAFYTDEARRLYALFTTVDFVFPFAAGLFLAATGAFCLRRSFPRLYSKLADRRLLPLFMLGSFFDWAENLAAISLIWSQAHPPEALAIALVFAKRAKLVFVTTAQLTVVALLASYAITTARERLRARVRIE